MRKIHQLQGPPAGINAGALLSAGALPTSSEVPQNQNSYLRSLVVRAVHRHRTGVGSIPAGAPYS